MMQEKKVEREKLIHRFIRREKQLYELGRKLNISWLNKYREEYERSLKGQGYFYIPSEDEKRLIEEIASRISDETLKETFDALKPKDSLVGCGFRGKYYYYIEGKELQFGDSQAQVKREVSEVLSQLGERGFMFLKALVELHREGRWQGDLFGASYSELLAKMRELAGRPIMPAPRDFAILKSYGIYYKSGSNKNPTHSIPEEIIPALEEALEEWQKTMGGNSQEDKEEGSEGAFHRSWDGILEEFK